MKLKSNLDKISPKEGVVNGLHRERWKCNDVSDQSKVRSRIGKSRCKLCLLVKREGINKILLYIVYISFHVFYVKFFINKESLGILVTVPILCLKIVTGSSVGKIGRVMEGHGSLW